MKKYILAAFLCSIIGPNLVFASMIISGTPFTPPATTINWSGSPSGRHILYMNATGLPICFSGTDSIGASGEINSYCATYSGTFDNTVPGTYQFIYQNNAICSSSDVYAVCRANNPDSGGSQEADFLILAPPAIATTTGYVLHKQEWLFLFAIFLFLSSVPFWDRILTIRRKYD